MKRLSPHTNNGGVTLQRALLRAAVCTCVLAASLAAGEPVRSVTAARTDVPPRLDGVLSEECWRRAIPTSEFTQYDPVEGATPTEETVVRLLYDDHALYVGALCNDRRPGRIVTQLSRRDRTTEADRFTVMIDSYFDRSTGFVFSANVSGVQSDGILSQGGYVYDITWDAVWRVKTARGKWGWSAEFAIPWSALRFSERGDSAYLWGINFRRYISRKKEVVEWVMVPRSEYYSIPRWGIVQGIRNIKTPLHLELAPYASAMRTSNTGDLPDASPSGTSGQVGLDIKYGVARNFTLDATINPDFGQVEVDASVLNLTVFETLYPEKRPFFLEGSQMFTFGGSGDNTPLMLFFSRRVGREPGGSADVVAPQGGTVEKNPRATTILGAAKLTGRTSSGLSVAALTALTDNEYATLRSPSGRTSVRTEPMGSYNVVRLKQELEGGSWYGGMATLASRDNAHPAIAGGVDWSQRFLGGRYTADGYLAGARAYNALGVPETGGAGRLLFVCVSADHWFPALSYDFYTPHFSINDLGFFAQPHDHGGYFQMVYREHNATGFLRRYYFNVNPEFRWNWDDGALTRANFRLEAIGELLNFWHVDVAYTRHFAAFDDRESGVLGLYRRPGRNEFTLTVQSPEHHDISATVTGTRTIGDEGERSVSLNPSFTIRPASWFEISPSFSYLHSANAIAWLYPDGNGYIAGSSLFGRRDLEYLDLSLHGIVTFTRTLSVQFFVQSFIARGRYNNYYVLLADGTLGDPAVEHLPAEGIPNHDFNTNTFNANVLLRWEYQPGSSLYLVWTQARSGYSGEYARSLGRRLGDTWLLPRQDTFVLKANYWFSL